jgi:hypothetical protein
VEKSRSRWGEAFSDSKLTAPQNREQTVATLRVFGDFIRCVQSGTPVDFESHEAEA